MSKVCQITGAKPSVGNNRSHALNATKRRFEPNLLKKKVFDPKTGKMKTMKISASALRTLTKKKGK
ncbi:MAG: 50S ribosomal protein L28 [Candidatus Gracilibacteria bacterium]|nr:50S ribosomal protein L28 [Candidatus Gracilibacteria bacterium]